MSPSYVWLRIKPVHHRAYLITLCSLALMVVIIYHDLTPSKLTGRASMVVSRVDDGFDSTGYVSRNETQVSTSSRDPHEIVVATVVCSQNSTFEEFIVMVKSAVLCQQSSMLRFIIFSDTIFFSEVENFLQNMQSIAENPFAYQVWPVIFPDHLIQYIASRDGGTVCGSQRIFFPDILRDEKYLLYVDTDTIFVNKLSVIWERFVSLSTDGRLAVMMEEDPDVALPRKFTFYAMATIDRVPIVGNLGVNAGIFFMDLTEMYKYNWVNVSVEAMKKYVTRGLPVFDQNIINIAFAENYPDKIQIGPCTFNYRISYCVTTNVCEEVNTDGASILHGYMRTFHPGRPYGKWSLLFRSIYESILQYEFGTDPYTNIIEPMNGSIQALPPDVCSQRANQILQNFVGLFPQS